MREAVRFADGLSWLASQRATRFLEIGPDGTLTAMAQGTLDPDEVLTVPVLRKDRPEPETLLTALARVHIHGARVDWTALLPGAQRVELPTYAFQRERFWPVPAAPAAPVSSGGGVADAGFWDVVERGDVDALAGQLGLGEGVLDGVVPALSSWWRGQREQSVVDRWRYRVKWQPVQMPSNGGRLNGRWLVLVPESSLTDAPVVEAVRGLAESAELVVCHPGSDRDELAFVLRDAVRSGPVDGVVSMLALPDGQGDQAADGNGVPVGVLGTAVVVQALGDAGVSARLWVLTRGGVATAGSDGVPDPGQAAVWGLGRVAGLEHPDRWGGLVDLPGALDERAVARLGSVLADGSEDQVALRKSGAFARRLAHAPAASPAGAGAGWVPGGTVLVTGGTGALGARVARWAVERGARHVVLTSRRGLSAPGATELEAELSELGARVTVEACDVADRDSVVRLLEEHTIDAVFHAAGVADATPLAELNSKHFGEVLAAKVLGAVHLDELTEGLDLSAFVVFSSIAGVWGSGGQPAYAAANAHLDALAQSRRARGLTATVGGLGPVGRQRHGGRNDAEEQLRRRGLIPLRPEIALRRWTGRSAAATRR